MRNLRRWFARNLIDLAYVSMLKHDAYVAIGEGRSLGFPVVLRPEGAEATGDLAWQSWGRFGRTIGRRCRRTEAFVSISRAITSELLGAGYDAARIHELPNGVPVLESPWRCRPDWRAAPRRAIAVGRLAPEKGTRDPGRCLAPRPHAISPGAADADRRGSPAARAGGAGRSARAARYGRAARPVGRSRRGAPRGGPLRPALARGGDEHRPARSHGAGHPAGRLGDPRQPAPGPRLQGRTARPPTTPTRWPVRSWSSGPTSTARSTWDAPRDSGSGMSSRSPPRDGGTWICSGA